MNNVYETKSDTTKASNDTTKASNMPPEQAPLPIQAPPLMTREQASALTPPFASLASLGPSEGQGNEKLKADAARDTLIGSGTMTEEGSIASACSASVSGGDGAGGSSPRVLDAIRALERQGMAREEVCRSVDISIFVHIRGPALAYTIAY